MVIKIQISDDDKTILDGELNDTETAKKIERALPVKSDPRFWGNEIYFEIPVNIDDNENPEMGLEVGDLAYWPDGHAFCIFFGPTPGSTGTEPRPASPVTVVGEITGDAEVLQDLDLESVSEVRIEKSA